MAASPNKITGQLDINTQYHFPMELIMARVAPMEDGYDLISTTQYITETQNSVARALAIPAHRWYIILELLNSSSDVSVLLEINLFTTEINFYEII